jgi:hypothetical protein
MEFLWLLPVVALGWTVLSNMTSQSVLRPSEQGEEGISPEARRNPVPHQPQRKLESRYVHANLETHPNVEVNPVGLQVITPDVGGQKGLCFNQKPNDKWMCSLQYPKYNNIEAPQAGVNK